MTIEHLSPAEAEHLTRIEQDFCSHVDRELASTQRQKVRNLSHDFFQRLYVSGRFSDMTVFQARDELNRRRLVLFLEELAPRSNAEHSSRDEISNTLSDLSIALRPNIFLDIFYNQPIGNEQDRERILKEEVKRRYKKASPRFVWQKPILLTPRNGQ